MASSTSATSQVDQNQFLQLMVKQLQSQDPLNPTDSGQMLAQLAQFSTLSGMEKLNTSFSEMLTLQEISQGSNLVGKQISYTNTSGASASGTVSAVNMSNGSVSLTVGKDSVSLSQITGFTGA
ncbi:flagellar hook assembly protein FlgD [Schlesneria paludicola]|uniref:flagellar hook assembly protein FlgD n=1 Tax=Schlesneria paludicola TaxID=360056 RepID=UPI00029A51D7|nr:flagellar hook capping FlgD N-terminal domain-containing protein [Schlesneria paludicola]